jgi:hypothetical protein
METVEEVVGKRIPLDNQGYFIHSEIEPGSYGRINRTVEQVHGFEHHLWWQVHAPDGSCCSLNPDIHTVTEHSDGTISVHPSIITSTWHGWLKRGIWKKA